MDFQQHLDRLIVCRPQQPSLKDHRLPRNKMATPDLDYWACTPSPWRVNRWGLFSCATLCFYRMCPATLPSHSSHIRALSLFPGCCKLCFSFVLYPFDFCICAGMVRSSSEERSPVQPSLNQWTPTEHPVVFHAELSSTHPPNTTADSDQSQCPEAGCCT